MKIMMLTHNSDRVKTRRFFVNATMYKVIEELEMEIHRIFQKLYVTQSNQSLLQLWQYVKWRIQALPMSEYTELVDLDILEKHLLDYCDVKYFRLFTGDKTRLVFRMFKYSEPLLVDKEK